MRAVILAGGQGKRLRPLTDSLPKPLLPVGDKPIMELIIGQLERDGFRDIYVATGYRSELIEAHFGDGSEFGVNIIYSQETYPLGTAGPLTLLDLPADDPVLTVNGDILTQASFRDIWRFHNKHQPTMTVCAAPHSVQIEYGVLETKGNRALGIAEKPQLHFDIFAGIAVLSPAALRHIPRGQSYQITDLAQLLCQNNSEVLIYRITAGWIDIGRPEHYEQANHLVEEWQVAA